MRTIIDKKLEKGKDAISFTYKIQYLADVWSVCCSLAIANWARVRVLL
jgi:hypothetical protein